MADKLDEADLLRFLLAREKVANANANLQLVVAGLATKHSLLPEDSFDPNTGIITRVAPQGE